MPPRAQTLELLSGAIGEKYDVLQWIGGGGMAEVFLARHRLHRGFCAVKVLASDLSDDRAVVRRFLQEARTAANLEGHPNIVRIVDIGEDQGLFYLIMPYVEGEDLASYLEREGRLSPEAAVYVIRQVADALAWAHSKGVVHRDLKPANVRLDPHGRVIVLDFGIAKAGATPTVQTMAGEKLGTPFYMAPEQIRGEPVDRRSDLYSLGVMSFELLTGKKPFAGDTYYAIEHGHLSTPAPAPDEWEPAVPPELGDIILRLLEKEPDNRYQSAEELLAALEPFGGTVAPASLRPVLRDDLERWRSGDAAKAPREFGGLSTTAAETWAEPPRTSAADAPAIPERGRGGPRAWPIFAAGGAVILLALGVALYFGGDTREAPAREPEGLESAGNVSPAESGGGVSPGETETLPKRISTPVGEMVLVPAGEFVFGDDSPESPNPRQTVDLAAFYIDVSEVSNAAYQQFCDATGHAPPEPPPWDRNYFKKLDYPVGNVSFEDAQAFAAWAGKRLPSEQEWEKAARGADARVYPWGNSLPLRQANVDGASDGFGNTAPVDAFAEGASPYGALNMAGNVWEWTASLYQPSAQELADMRTVVAGGGPQWNVLKGGSFVSPRRDPDLRAYLRAAFPGRGQSPYFGFRCVKDAR